MTAMRADAFQGCATKDLASGAQFTVWCLRTRLVCKRKGEDARPRIDHGFQVAGVPEAARDFDQIFDWLDGAAVRPVAIGCFCRRRRPGRRPGRLPADARGSALARRRA
jgi:hypothetical protein